MADLTALCRDIGCGEVRSYIQSGNIIFTALPDAVDTLTAQITAQIAERFSYRIPVVLRSREELAAVIADNPFLTEGIAEDALHVLFLADLPSDDKVTGLDPNRSAPDTFVVRGWEVYLHLPNGMADTKLTNAYFDTKLATVSTARNWKTVTKLLALMSV